MKTTRFELRRGALALLFAAGCSYTTCEAPPRAGDKEARGSFSATSFTATPAADEGWPEDGTGPAPDLRSQPSQEERRLRGGELDDNDRFEEYLRYRDRIASRVAGKTHPIDVSDRLMLRVLDAAGRPTSGAKVVVKDLGGRVLARRTTYADGRALFFPRAEDAQGEDEWLVEATLGDAQARRLVTRGTEAAELRLDGERSPNRPALDVVFCLDCTGSMGDEIDRLKATLDSVARRLTQLPGSPRLRLGLVKYRDRCDSFVVAKDELTHELSTFRANLARAYADGGGDYPEDVQAGLAAAVDDMSWDRSANAVRLVFLVGDAPPHLYGDEQGYDVTLRHAAEKGVKVCTLAASGLDDAGECVWRQCAEATLGRFIFISYGLPGGGRGTPHHTGPYLENDLDDIVVKQCAREVAALVD